jgi:hypothetical protein
MNPKDKAQELYLKHRSIIAEKQLASNFMLISEATKITKKCALIAVDEILDNCENIFEAEYWKEVKQEINLL